MYKKQIFQQIYEQFMIQESVLEVIVEGTFFHK